MATTATPGYSYGLQVDGVKLGDIPADGGISTTMTSPGKVKDDTITVNPLQNTVTDFKAAGESDPSVSITQRGVRDGSFEIMTFDLSVIADLTGGTVTGIGADMEYSAPADPADIYKTLEFVDKQGRAWIYPRVQISADLTGRFKPNDINTVTVNFKVLSPTKAGVPSFKIGKPIVASSNP